MVIENFTQWSAQFEVLMNRLIEHEQAVQQTRQQYAYANQCMRLRKMSNDIRGLGFCYDNLKKSLSAHQQQLEKA